MTASILSGHVGVDTPATHRNASFNEGIATGGLGYVRAPLGAANRYANATQRHEPLRETLAAFAWGHAAKALGSNEKAARLRRLLPE